MVAGWRPSPSDEPLCVCSEPTTCTYTTCSLWLKSISSRQARRATRPEALPVSARTAPRRPQAESRNLARGRDDSHFGNHDFSANASIAALHRTARSSSTEVRGRRAFATARRVSAWTMLPALALRALGAIECDLWPIAVAAGGRGKIATLHGGNER